MPRKPKTMALAPKRKLESVAGEVRKRNPIKGSTEQLEEFIEEYGLTAAMVNRELGLSDGVSQHWIKIDQMPAWVLVAIDGMRWARNKTKAEAQIIVVRPGAHAEMLIGLLKSLDMPWTTV